MDEPLEWRIRSARCHEQRERGAHVQVEELLVAVAARGQGAAQVVDGVDALDGGAEGEVVFEPPGPDLDRGGADEVQARVVRQDEGAHLVTAGGESPGEVGANAAGGAGSQDPHLPVRAATPARR